MVVVTTREELKKAVESKADRIEVKGKLAGELRKARKVAKLSKLALIPLVALVGAIPLSGGLSAGVAAAAAAMTGLEISAIIFAATIGLTMVIAVSKNYDEVGATGPFNMSLQAKKGRK